MKLELDVGENGLGRVILNGKDISRQILGFQLTCHVGESTRLEMEYAPVAVSGTADVEPECVK